MLLLLLLLLIFFLSCLLNCSCILKIGIAARERISGCFEGNTGRMWLWGLNEYYQIAKGDDQDDSIEPCLTKFTK